jgi:hypothetical protein
VQGGVGGFASETGRRRPEWWLSLGVASAPAADRSFARRSQVIVGTPTNESWGTRQRLRATAFLTPCSSNGMRPRGCLRQNVSRGGAGSFFKLGSPHGSEEAGQCDGC